MEETILLLADNASLQEKMVDTLAAMGRSAIARRTPAQALQVLESRSPEDPPVIILAQAELFQVPHEVLLPALKRPPAAAEVIVVSDPDRPAEVLNTLALGADDFIDRGANQAEISAALKRAQDRLSLQQRVEKLRAAHRRQYGADFKPHKSQFDLLLGETRQTVAQQVVEGLSAAIRGLVSEIEGGQKYFNEMPCFVSIHNQDRRVVAVNRLSIERLGDKVGRESWEICSLVRPDPTGCPVHMTFVTAQSQRSRETVKDVHGEDLPLLVHTLPIVDDDGEVVLVLALAADLTELSHLKDLLSTTEARYQQLFDEAPCYISVQDEDLALTAANKRFKADFGDNIGRPCFEIYKRRDEPCQVCPVRKTFETGESQSTEEVVTALDGRQIHTLTWTAPILDAEGRITHVMEMSTDITMEKRFQEELREAQQRYRQLFDEVPCYISVQDKNFRVTAANRRFKEDFGDRPEAHCFQLYKHRTSQCNECPVAMTFEDGQSHSTEEVVTALDGRKINTLTWTTPIRDHSGELTHVIEMSTDITQIRQMQDHLTNLGLLIGAMSHGVKGLLTGLDGGMYLMKTGLERGDQSRLDEGWKTLRLMVDRIKSTVLDILYYAKERDLKWERVEVLEFAKGVINAVEPKAREHGIDFVSRFDLTTGRFEVDAGVAASALVNFLENAVDACLEDTAKDRHQIIFTVGERNGRVTFEVSDNGLGMDQETMDNIFTLFFSSKGSSGTGLGLYIANEVIRQHGGTIEVESTLGEGSRFLISMPKIISERKKPIT